jgi:hypothetical protein
MVILGLVFALNQAQSLESSVLVIRLPLDSLATRMVETAMVIGLSCAMISLVRAQVSHIVRHPDTDTVKGDKVDFAGTETSDGSMSDGYFVSNLFGPGLIYIGTVA